MSCPNCNHQSCDFNIYEGGKCIFHCEKNMENGWVAQSTEKYDKVNDKIKLFWQEEMVFLINEKISNFSQSWFLPLLWIFIINFIFFNLYEIIRDEDSVLNLSIFLLVLIMSWIVGRLIYEIKQSGGFYLAQHLSLLFGVLTYTIYNSSIVDMLQFSHIQSYKDYSESYNNSIFYLWFMHKLILGFIIYHFVVALRRQTRR